MYAVLQSQGIEVRRRFRDEFPLSLNTCIILTSDFVAVEVGEMSGLWIRREKSRNVNYGHQNSSSLN